MNYYLKVVFELIKLFQSFDDNFLMMLKRRMFGNALPEIFKRAKELRNNLTPAEMALWLHLRKGINGFKFRRQHPIETYCADFYCHKVKLVIEVDGSIHNDPAQVLNDELREQDLKRWSYVILRFTNNQIYHDIESVLNEIENTIKALNNK